MSKSNFEIEFLSKKEHYYLSKDIVIPDSDYKQYLSEDILKDVALYRIHEISFDEKAPRKEALENVLSSMRVNGVNFIYLILGDKTGVNFYYGISKDYLKETDIELSICEVGKFILEPSIKGNFRGSKTEMVIPEEKERILKSISKMEYCSILEGVPGYTKEDEKFQGVDRLVDVMQGDIFGFMVIASSVDYDGIKEIEYNLYRTYSQLASMECPDKNGQEWLRYLDNVIIPRLDYGMGKGIFVAVPFLFSNEKASLKKLENTAISLYSGEIGNKIPLKAVPLQENERKLQILKNFQFPGGNLRQEISQEETAARSALSQFIKSEGFAYLGNWITTNELSLIAGLPQKDVIGLELKEEVEFGLNIAENPREKDRIYLGNIIQSGNIIEKRIYLDKKNLDKHIFITGVTGSGKTTTCHKILMDSGLPFLVIEPAKTEYRILLETYKDMIVFTLGKDTVAPFRLNPFEFFRHENITSRVDMIMASIEAAFDMEAAIPQLIESAIYQCYEDYGWNIASNQNRFYGETAFADGVYAFPTLEDMIKKVEIVVANQGFDERMKNDYIGSIKARLQGLLAGSKGLMLNTRRSVDFQKLLSQKVVLELEEIRSAAEKSLVMGFILINLTEAIKESYKPGICRHITLVEEAHRLLGKYIPGDSAGKKHSIETFSDMLAEIRKYGESLIIVDQIPDKMTPEVLKNTNTKIVHRLFAEDDKSAVGNTIVLNQEQKGYLSNLGDGHAIVFTQGFHKAVQVQLAAVTNTTGKTKIREKQLRRKACLFYRKNYKRGIFVGTQIWEYMPSEKEMRDWIELSREKQLKDIIDEFCRNTNWRSPGNQKYAELLTKYKERYKISVLARYLLAMQEFENFPNVHKQKQYEKSEYERMEKFVSQYVDRTMSYKDAIEFKNYFLNMR